MEGLPAIVLLLHLSVMLGGSEASWVVPTKKLKENFDYTTAGYVAKIRSDWDEDGVLSYSLLGPGANQVPVNLFVVEQYSGLVFILGKLDREERETYILTGVAKFLDNRVAETAIQLRFDVEDENDNPPVFVPVPPATVNESSPAGTLVGMITATDADKANCSHSKIAYSIEKQEPFNGTDFFYIDRETGAIYVKESTLDRETQSSYILTIKGTDMDGAPEGNTGTGTILIKVVDINDNRPMLEKDEYAGSIVENTANVEVMRFKVLDPDEQKTDNWLADFDIVSGNDDGIFSIKTDPKTNEGVLMLEKPVDFEENPDIKLGVVVSNVAPFVGDGDGEGGGQGGGGGEGGGEGDGNGDGDGGGDGGGQGGGGGGGEGDGDGDGGGGANVDMGAEAGAGAGVGAGAGAGAEAGGNAGAGGKAKKPSKKKRRKKGKIYPVNIAVLNEREGVAFKPAVKPVSVSENPEENPLMEVIAVFAATDTDTGEPAENVRYAKGHDPDNWLLIDPETAEIKLQKAPDRESPFVVNGTYYAKILSLPQDTNKIVTGTIALQVGDVNDNCPSLTNDVEYLCSNTEVVNVTAVDEDGDPNSAPFSFNLVEEESQGEWRVEPLNDTSASLRALRPLWPGHYQVAFTIQDQQGFACPEPQYLELHVCSCEGRETCGAVGRGAFLKESSSTFGGLGVGALILGFLTLLIIVVLLTTCSCGGVSEGFSELPFVTSDHMIVYHTEGRGEDKDVLLLSSPVQVTSAAISAVQAGNVAYNTKANATNSYMYLNMGTAKNSYKSRFGVDSRIQQTSLAESRDSCWREMYSMEEQLLQYDHMDGIALPDEFLHQYYSQKSSCAAENQAARDCLLEYDYEGQGSSAGSVGCCSLLESDNDLQFLEDLGPKFKTLAEICSPPRHPIPLARQSIVIPQADEVDHIAVPILEAEPPSIHGKSPEHNQSVSISQSSTRVMDLNGTASSSMHMQSAHSTSCVAQSPHVSPVTRPGLPSAGQMLLLQQQQPVYYTTTPVLQSMHYVVQPQLQSTVLLAEAPVTNLQSMILVNGRPGHTGHILQGRNTAGTLTLGRKIANVVVEENQGVRAWPRSDGPAEVIDVRSNGRRIMSEGGAVTEHCDMGMVIGGHISVGAAGSEEGQVVFKERGSKTRSRSTVSLETGFRS